MFLDALHWLFEKMGALVDWVIDFLINAGRALLYNLDLGDEFDELRNQVEFYASWIQAKSPIINVLIDIPIVMNSVNLAFSIMMTVLIFKITVKLIPTVY